MAFKEWFKNLVTDLKSGVSKIKTDGEALLNQCETNIGPIGYSLLQVAVAGAEVTGGAWNVKLATAIETASVAFARQNLPVVINDMVATIAVIVNDLNQGTAKLQTATAAVLPAGHVAL